MKPAILAALLPLLTACAALGQDGIADIVEALPSTRREQILKDFYREELDDIRKELPLSAEVLLLEQPRLEPAADASGGYVPRSRHFVFGMPRLTDNRYANAAGSGVSLLFREAFVVAFADDLGSPIWVAQRWSAENLKDKIDTPSVDRDFLDDPEVPLGVRRGTDYRGNTTGLDRGHLAKHSMNRAWGFDGSIAGCLMTNITPQHRKINRQPGAWFRLEEEVEDVVEGDDVNFRVIWTISGAVFQDADHAAGESPRDDLQRAGVITDGFKVPYATYKIAAWFAGDGKFHARGFLFEQPYAVAASGLTFDIPDQSQPLAEYIVPIREIERRTGVNFFPLLVDALEDLVETPVADDLWGIQPDDEG